MITTLLPKVFPQLTQLMNNTVDKQIPNLQPQEHREAENPTTPVQKDKQDKRKHARLRLPMR